MAQLCQVAWNQGVDLFGYDNNRLLAGAEYVAATALLQNPPFAFYNNDAEAKNYWLSVNGCGRMNSPVWELVYNHYVVRRGLKSPYLTAMAKLTRPETGGGDHFGYGTLTFTLDAAASTFPGMEVPAAPKELTATSGLGRVYLNWQNPIPHDASGYIVRRARADGGSYETIADRDKNIANFYTDDKAERGVAYRYVVAARNPAGVGPDSKPVTAQAEAPGPLPDGWTMSFIGDKAGYKTDRIEAAYSKSGSQSLYIKGVGKDVGGQQDSATFVGREVKGDFTLIGRLVVSPQVAFPNDFSPKMGLMIRESLEPSSPCASIALGDVGLRGTRARFRGDPNVGVSTFRGNDYSWMPIWYRIERKADTFTTSHRMDGTDWFEVGTATIKMPPQVLVGFFATGSDNSKTGMVEVIFDNTSINQPK